MISDRLAWEWLPGGCLLMRLDTGDMVRLSGAAADTWKDATAGQAPADSELLRELRRWAER